MTDWEVRKSYAPVGGFLLLAVILAGLILAGVFTSLPTSVVSVTSSAILVLITAFYAWQARKSTQHTEDSLDEMRKDRQKHGKTLTIAFGIDAIKSDLDRYREKWENLDDDSYPHLGHEWDLPEQEVLNDIEEVYPETGSDFQSYISKFEEYQKKRQQLIEEVQTHILKNKKEIWRDISPHREYPSEIVDPAEELATADDLNKSFEAARDIAEFLAHYAINPDLEPERYGVEVDEDVWERRRKEVTEVRKSDEFREEIAELGDVFREVVELNRTISENLSEARAELKKEYGITDLEVEEIRNTSDLEEPDIVLEYDQLI